MDIETFLGNNPDSFKPVGRTEITAADGNTYYVSTMFFGINRLYGLGWLAETIVFDPRRVAGEPRRYPTERAAVDGHAETVTAVAATLADPVITDLGLGDYGADADA